MYQKGCVFLICSCSNILFDYIHTKEGIVSIGIDSVTVTQNSYLHYVHIAGEFNFVY